MTTEFSIEALFKYPPSTGWVRDGETLTVYKDGEVVSKVPLEQAERGYFVSPPVGVCIDRIHSDNVGEFVRYAHGIDDEMVIGQARRLTPEELLAVENWVRQRMEGIK